MADVNDRQERDAPRVVVAIDECQQWVKPKRPRWRLSRWQRAVFAVLTVVAFVQSFTDPFAVAAFAVAVVWLGADIAADLLERRGQR
jgi:hypothetical protein